jgi:Fic family protein
MSFRASDPFDLPLLPPKENFHDPLLVRLVALARTQLGELNGLSLAIPNAFLLITPVLLKEAISSCEIENIHTTLAEAFQAQLLPEKERRPQDKEVTRCRDAILWADAERERVAISSRLLLGIHNVLMGKSSGEFRKIHNRIEYNGTGSAIYTPPVASNVLGLISNWEKFVNEQNDHTSLDPLIRASIAHYQFEAIHPFEDGNGRCARILMVMQLMECGLLGLPVLYLSGYIHEHKAEYYRLLLDVSRKGEWLPYLKFMITAIGKQAMETKRMIARIMRLHAKMRDEAREKCPRVKNPGDLVEHLFAFPVTSPLRVQKDLGVHYTTGTRYLNALLEAGLVKEKWVGKNHFFINHRLLAVANQKEE